MANMDVLETAEAQVAGLWGLSSTFSTPPQQALPRGNQGANSASQGSKDEQPRKFFRANGKGGKGKGPGKKRQEHLMDGDTQGDGRSQSSEFQMLKTLVLRHEHSLSQLAVDRTYVLFFNTSDMSTLTLLKEVTNNWQKAYQEKKTTTSLRAALLTSLWLELKARMNKLEADQKATKLYVDSGHLHLEPTRWSYTEWDQETCPRMHLR